MTLPVLQQAAEHYPETEITVVSDLNFADLFKLIPRCNFFPADLKGQHAGTTGMWKLFRELHNYKPVDAVIDLHGVLRTHLLSVLFRINGIAVRKIDKGRKEKKALTRQHYKLLKQLTPMPERYAEVFAAGGLPFRLVNNQIPLTAKKNSEWLQQYLPEAGTLIGVAPFARHREKMLPLEKSRQLVEALCLQGKQVLLFGGGKEEAAILMQWQEEIKGSVLSVAGQCSFGEELKIISSLSVMVSMDSANMHLASLFGIPVVSIWGATHPFAGFYGWAQQEANAIGIDLPCRPCSVFGNKPCFRGDHLCMQQISITGILDRVDHCLRSA